MTTMRYPRSLNRCRNRGLPYLTGVGSDKGVMVIIPFPLSTDQRFNQLVANLEAVNLYISTFIAQYLNMDIGLRTHHESVVSHLTVVLDSELNQLRDSLDDECEYDQMLQVLIEDEYYTGNWLKMASSSRRNPISSRRSASSSTRSRSRSPAARDRRRSSGSPPTSKSAERPR